jgi:hypothetical protein
MGGSFDTVHYHYSFVFFRGKGPRVERCRMIFAVLLRFLGSHESTGLKWLGRAVASMSEKVMFLFWEYHGALSSKRSIPVRNWLTNHITAKQ